MTAISNTFITILEFILSFGVLIFIHEFGHFIVARMSHIDVEEFGIGYPPKAVKLFRFWGTDFTLNWIPFGGFCRMKGESGDITEPGSFTAATPWQRLFRLLGGPVMNLLLGMVLITIIILRMGTSDPTRVQIESVSADSPASLVNLQVGDIIEKINDQPVSSLDSLSALVKDSLGKSMELTLLRGSETLKAYLINYYPA